MVVQVYLQEGHMVHKPSGTSFFSAVDVLMPFFLLLNQLFEVDSCSGSAPDNCSLKSSSRLKALFWIDVTIANITLLK
jgi:hypothetical protein